MAGRVFLRMEGFRGNLKRKDLYYVVFVIFVTFAVVTVKPLIENRMRAKAGGQLTACYIFVQRTGVALERYKDKNGSYPKDLSSLCPAFIKTIPTCPAASKDRYSAGYEVSGDFLYFTLYCCGNYHRNMGIPENFPRYTSREGMMENY
jgi:hypothetical protein